MVVTGATVAAITRQTPPYHQENFELIRLPFTSLPWSRKVERALESGGVYDEFGVRLVEREGELFEQPVSQAQYALRMLSSYRASGKGVYLDAARSNAERIHSYAEEVNGALYFPYPFDLILFGDEDLTLKSPWYSGMAQGQVLSVFLRMYQATGIDAWMEWAEQVFASFLPVDEFDLPFTPNLDEQGYLWFEEYPQESQYQEVFNGQVFALYGVYEYWLLTGDSRAEPLVKGILTTMKHRAEEFRVEGQPSNYSTRRTSQPDRYHQIHTCQLLEMYSMTGDTVLAKLADTFAEDYPPYLLTADLTIPAGTYEIRTTVSDKPHLLWGESISYEFPEITTLAVSERRREHDAETFWYRIAEGKRRGQWIQETDDVRVTGPHLAPQHEAGPLFGSRMLYTVPRRIALGAGTYAVYDALEMEVMEPLYSLSVTVDVSGECNARQLISGTPYLLIRLSGSPDWNPEIHSGE